jgi:hypothetical protein
MLGQYSWDFAYNHELEGGWGVSAADKYSSWWVEATIARFTGNHLPEENGDFEVRKL